jgi:RNA polymerase sigma-70 factor (ECF subfamily)
MSRPIDPRVAERLAELQKAAIDAWPGVTVPADAFAAYVVERLPAEGEVLEALSSLRTRELYLTCACSRGDKAALAAFDATYLGPVGHELERVGYSSAVVEDALQVVRDRLFVGDSIVDYAGRGDLGRWVRAAAARAAIRVGEKEKSRGTVRVDDAVLEIMSSSEHDIELDFLKRTYGREFERAAREAFNGMTPRDRNLLRYYFVRRLTIDELATVYRIHRATVARQVKKANAELVEKTRLCLAAALGIPPSDVSSILRLIQSQIELVLGNILGSTALEGR